MFLEVAGIFGERGLVVRLSLSMEFSVFIIPSQVVIPMGK